MTAPESPITETTEKTHVDAQSEAPKPLAQHEEVTFITTGSRKALRKAKTVDDAEPLVDTTAPIPLRSKKTERAQRRLQKRHAEAAQRPVICQLLDLPPELLQAILGYLRPSDVVRLQRVSRNFREFILENENSIARDIIRWRYWVLARCFPLPVAFQDVDSTARPALLSEKRQDMLQIHKKPYQHVKGIDPLHVCTCMNCVFAWNNLCLILDLSYWQKNLSERNPIPMIRRGTFPEWNRQLLNAHAATVETAMVRRLCHARILEKHLSTTVGTIMRTVKRKQTAHLDRLYHLTAADAETETDEFLERGGPPSYEFPWQRDNYYGLEAYVPNRKWSKENARWMYYAQGLHDKDLQWVKDRFNPDPATESNRSRGSGATKGSHGLSSSCTKQSVVQPEYTVTFSSKE